MQTEKKTIVIFSIIKAVATTAILGLAINGVNNILSITDSHMGLAVIIGMGFLCITGAVIYLFGLWKEGFLKTISNLIHLYGLSWEDNAERLMKSWAWGGIPVLIFCGIFATINYLGTFGGFCLGFSTASAVSFVYISRNECKTIMDRVKYLLYGYVFGVVMIAAGIITGFLISLFGIFWIGGLILMDAVFTGFYTYLDLLDWERENKEREEKKIQSPTDHPDIVIHDYTKP
jgi:hypothetical protein